MPRKTDPRTGAPLYLRDSRYASRFFGTQGATFTGTPHYQWMFYVRFVLNNPEDGLFFNQFINANDPLYGLSRKVKSFDRPAFSFNTETKHQYNKRRNIQTGIEYIPITVQFWDTVDNLVMRLIADYYRYYYGDGRKEDQSDWEYDVTKGDFRDKQPIGFPTGTGWGFNPPAKTPNKTPFFSHIELYQIHGKKFNRTKIINPLIDSYTPSQNNYESTSEGNEIGVTFRYEGIVYDKIGENIDNEPETARMLGFQTGDFYEPDNSTEPSSTGQGGASSKGNFLNDTFGVGGLFGGKDPGFGFGDIFESVAQGGINTIAQDLIRTGTVDFDNVLDQAGNNALSGFGNYFFGDQNIPFTFDEDITAKLARLGRDAASSVLQNAGNQQGVSSSISGTLLDSAQGALEGQGASRIAAETLSSVYAQAKKQKRQVQSPNTNTGQQTTSNNTQELEAGTGNVAQEDDGGIFDFLSDTYNDTTQALNDVYNSSNDATPPSSNQGKNRPRNPVPQAESEINKQLRAETGEGEPGTGNTALPENSYNSGRDTDNSFLSSLFGGGSSPSSNTQTQQPSARPETSDESDPSISLGGLENLGPDNFPESDSELLGITGPSFSQDIVKKYPGIERASFKEFAQRLGVNDPNTELNSNQLNVMTNAYDSLR